ncbi:MAG: hypothetical protein ACFE0P_13960 [Oceanicaulis sp.]
MLGLLFDPRGRIASGPFLKAVMIILACQWVLGLPGALGAPALINLALGLVGLAFTYALICAWVKRLRGAGRSGWWVIAVFVANFILGVALLTPIWAGVMLVVFSGGSTALSGSITPAAMLSEADRLGWVLILGGLVIHTLSLAIPYAVAWLVDRELRAEAGERIGAPP